MFDGFEDEHHVPFEICRDVGGLLRSLPQRCFIVYNFVGIAIYLRKVSDAWRIQRISLVERSFDRCPVLQR